MFCKKNAKKSEKYLEDKYKRLIFASSIIMIGYPGKFPARG